MEREEIVIDASVAIKWFTQEEHKDKALLLRDSFIKEELDIIFPDLILYEISNALRYNPNFSQKDVKDSIGSILDMDITITTPSESILNEAIHIAFTKSITIYDAVYIALASELSCHFITADEKLYRKVKDLSFIFLLADYNF